MATSISAQMGSRARREIGSAGGWFIGLGVLLVMLGALAFSNLPAATAATVYTIGILMLIGAGLHLITAFLSGSWGRFGLLVLSALFYGIAGGLVFGNPKLAASALTLVLGMTFIFSGSLRVACGVAIRPMPGSNWVMTSGVMSLLAGIVFIAGWPANTLYLLGMVLAVDLTFQGATAIGWGIALRKVGG